MNKKETEILQEEKNRVDELLRLKDCTNSTERYKELFEESNRLRLAIESLKNNC